MGPVDLSRPLLGCVVAGVLLGLLIALGLPWIWHALLKPILVWLVL